MLTWLMEAPSCRSSRTDSVLPCRTASVSIVSPCSVSATGSLIFARTVSSPKALRSGPAPMPFVMAMSASDELSVGRLASACARARSRALLGMAAKDISREIKGREMSSSKTAKARRHEANVRSCRVQNEKVGEGERASRIATKHLRRSASQPAFASDRFSR